MKIPVENLLGSKWSVVKNFVPIEGPFALVVLNLDENLACKF